MSEQTASERLAESLAMTLNSDKVHAVIAVDAPRFWEMGDDERERAFTVNIEGMARDLRRELDEWKARQS